MYLLPLSCPDFLLSASPQVCCHKSTGWEAVQLALLSSLDGTSYLFHNDPLRLSSPSRFIFVSLSLIQTCSLINTCPLLCLYTHLPHDFSVKAAARYSVIRSGLTHSSQNTLPNTASSGEQLYPALSKGKKVQWTDSQHDCQPYRHPTICSYRLCSHI